MSRHTVLWMMIALLLAGTAGPGAVSAQQPILIKLGNVQATADIVQTGLKKFADLGAERRKGRIQRSSGQPEARASEPL